MSGFSATDRARKTVGHAGKAGEFSSERFQKANGLHTSFLHPPAEPGGMFQNKMENASASNRNGCPAFDRAAMAIMLVFFIGRPARRFAERDDAGPVSAAHNSLSDAWRT